MTEGLINSPHAAPHSTAMTPPRPQCDVDDAGVFQFSDIPTRSPDLPYRWLIAVQFVADRDALVELVLVKPLFVCLFVCLFDHDFRWSVVDIALPRIEPALPKKVYRGYQVLLGNSPWR